MASLERQRLEQAARQRLLGAGWPAFDLAVDRGDGRPWVPTSFSRRWRVLAERQGIEWVTFKTLRLG
jgi:hypothetical protein